MQGNQRRRTGRIDGYAGTTQVKQVRQAVRRDGLRVTRGDIRIVLGAKQQLKLHVVNRRNTDKRTRGRTGKTVGADAGILKSFPRDVQ